MAAARAESSLVDRMVAYMRKAVREARVHSSWMHVDEEYEAGLEAFVRGLLTDAAASEFRHSLRSMVERILPLSVLSLDVAVDAEVPDARGARLLSKRRIVGTGP
jgi:maltooligosyltrehalose synthase